MDNDDVQVGRLLSRREVLALMGGASLALLVGCSDDDDPATASPTSGATRAPAGTSPAGTATGSASGSGTAVPSCVVRPELTEGPYFVDGTLERSDIRSDPSDGSVVEGAPFTLTFMVSSVAGAACQPLEGATVELWHCDALGVYSGVQDPGFDTADRRFLRGHQVTDASGKAEFITIYPGWYEGRAVHMHFKVITGAGSGQASEFTSQLFFDDALSDQVYTQAPYSEKGGTRSVRNANDGIFRDGGDVLLLDVQQQANAYAATFAIGVDLT